jgi:hypothetical protein
MVKHTLVYFDFDFWRAEAPRLIMHVGGASSESLADHSKLRVDIIVTFVLL